MEKMIRRSHKSSFKEGDYFPFEVFLIVRYHLYRVKKNMRKDTIHCLWVHTSILVIKPV